ncbi:hypothetical protein B0H13DRAFT_1892913 [Mycena leptocephala]|nr:hypothetical protein B0H13DRAFT_1892913 [Mycena leptocephala]
MRQTFPESHNTCYQTIEPQANEVLRQITSGSNSVTDDARNKRPSSMPFWLRKLRRLISIGLGLVQIALGHSTWVLVMWKLSGLPAQATTDVPGGASPQFAFQRDYQGLWAKLFLEERHPKAPHGNLPLKFSVKEILGVRFQRPEKAICGPSSGPTSKHNVRLSTYPQGPRVTWRGNCMAHVEQEARSEVRWTMGDYTWCRFIPYP